MKKFESFFKFCKLSSYLFIILGIVFIPFSYNLFTYQEKITSFFFGKIISIVKPFIFQVSKYELISSDSSSLYVLIFILIILAILIQSVLFTHKKFNKYLTQILHIAVPYYLSLILLKYGFDKVSMGQFYSPEANLLYTPLGFLEKDILFWSIIGTSPLYNLLLGISQIITAILLLLKKTRFLGLVLSTFIFINIVAVNMSFDISVKAFSIFLLFMSIIGLLKYNFIFIRIFEEIKAIKEKSFLVSKDKFFYSFLKSFIILLFLFEVCYAVIQKKISYKENEYSNFANAYLVIETLENNLLMENDSIKRIFIHKDGYLIFQNINDEMTDYKLQVFKEKQQFVITDYDLKETKINYEKRDSLLVLKFTKNEKAYQLTTKVLDHLSLPIFRDSFHWAIDAI